MHSVCPFYHSVVALPKTLPAATDKQKTPCPTIAEAERSSLAFAGRVVRQP
jgi:hypothetical protein